MSYVKGRRKSTKPVGIKIGKAMVPSNVVIPALMVLLFVVLTVAGAYEHGFDALLLRLTGFALFAALAYSVRSGLRAMAMYSRLIDAFAGLFGAQTLLGVAEYLHLYDSAPAGLGTPLLFAVLNLIAAVVLILGLLFLEKDAPAKIFWKAGRVSEGLKIGIPALVAGATLSVILGYQLYGTGLSDTSKLPALFGALAAFSVAMGMAGEAWFRGLFLSRLLPLSGDRDSLILQAIVYAFFQAAVFYAFTSSLLYACAILVVSAIAGYVFAKLTLRYDSILTAALSAIGINLVLALPLFAVLIHP